MKKYFFILIIIIFASCVEDTIIVSFPSSIIKYKLLDNRCKVYEIVDFKVDKVEDSLVYNQYICKNIVTGNIIKFFSFKNADCKTGNNVIFNIYDTTSNSGLIQVRSTELIEYTYANSPIFIGNISFLSSDCVDNTDF